MSRKALLEERFQKIKDHIMHPEDSELNAEQQKMLDRWTYGAKILAKYPVKRNAVALLRQQFPEVSKSTAYEDLRYAEKLFNVNHVFNKEFWFNWLIQDIADLIYKAKNAKVPIYDKKTGKAIRTEIIPDLNNWNKAHQNLIKILADIPQESVDPRLTEKHNIYFPIQVNNNTYNLDLAKLLRMKPEQQKKISDAIQDVPIDESTAEDIMKS